MLGAWVVLALAAGNWECEYSQKKWSRVGLDAPCVVVPKEQSSTEQLASARKRWSLSEPQARCAVEAATLAPPKNTRPTTGGDFASWRRCVEQWPDRKALWTGLILSWDFKEALDELVAKLPPAPADGGTSIAEELLGIDLGPQAALALHVLKTQPRRLGSFLTRFHAFEVALTTFEERRDTIGASDWEPLGRALVSEPLQGGDLAFAAELWLALPESVQAAVRSKPVPVVWAHFAGDEPVPFEEGDQRPLLALGLIVAGRKDAARLIPLGEADPLLKDLIAWHLTGQRTLDPWEAAIAARESRDGRGGDFYAALYPFIAPHQGLHDLRWRVMRGFGPVTDRSYSAAHLARLAAARAKSFERMKALVSQLETVDAGMAAPVTLPPAPAPFSERKSPWKGAAPVVVDAKQHRLPPGFWPVRAERLGKRLVVLALSQRLDPVGEVSPGAYWLLTSSNGANSWTQVYLGLGEHRPWHAHEASKVPLLDEKDVVRLAVEEAPIREETISFPPVATQAPTVRENVVLEAKLSDLTRDSDGDGLTDLVEARLLLDPSKPDTDGDGMKDGDDPTPRLDDRLAPTELAEVYNAFFEAREERPVALVTKPGSKNALEVKPRTADLEDTRFLVGTPAELGGLKPLNRVVTLSAAELEAARARYGSFYPDHLTVFLNGNDHAFIQFSNGWSGGTCRIDRDASGKWVVTMLESWVS